MAPLGVETDVYGMPRNGCRTHWLGFSTISLKRGGQCGSLAPEEGRVRVEAMEWQQRSGVKSKSITLSVDGVVMMVGKSLQRFVILRVILCEAGDSDDASWPGVEKVI